MMNEQRIWTDQQIGWISDQKSPTQKAQDHIFSLLNAIKYLKKN